MCHPADISEPRSRKGPSGVTTAVVLPRKAPPAPPNMPLPNATEAAPPTLPPFRMPPNSCVGALLGCQPPCPAAAT